MDILQVNHQTMKKSTLIILILIILVAGYLALTNRNKSDIDVNSTTYRSEMNEEGAEINTPSPAGDDTVTPNEDQGSGTGVSVGGNIAVAPAPVTKTVTYTDSGFSPSTITIKAGDTVRFVNSSSENMWVASDPHPQHTNYSPFDAKKGYEPGTTYAYTFTEKKTYTYHNHPHSNIKGTIVVQ